MDDQDLLRYSKHILLEPIDIAGQNNILQSKILIIGCGGLGNTLAMYLATNGVQAISLIDHDIVELSNLPRQIAFDPNDINQLKVEALQQRLQQLNPRVQCIAINHKLDADNIESIIVDHPIIVDCTDDIATKKLINQTAKRLKKIHVFTSVVQFTGYFALFDFTQQKAPCLSCLFPETSELENYSNPCLNHGVYTPMVGMVSMFALNEILKLLGRFGTPNPLFWHIQGDPLMFRSFKMTKDPNCRVCHA